MLTDSQIQRFEDEGYLRLGQVASDELVAAMQRRINEIMLGQVVYEGMFFQLDANSSDYGALGKVPNGYQGATLNYRKIQDLERDPIFLEYIQQPLFGELCRRFIGEDISVFRAMFMNKPAHQGTELPYHQDAGDQWSLDRQRFFTIWTALDDATVANGCVQIVPGSHKLGLLSERGHTITAEQEAEHARDEDSVYLEVPAGEAVLLDNLILHRSGVNTIERPRRAFSVVYMDAATRNTRSGKAYPKVFGEGALVAG